MSQRITKIKRKTGLITVHAVEGEGSTDEAEITRKVYAEPHPDFIKAFDALEAHVRALLEWPETYAKDRVTISGVSFSLSEDTGVEGAVMTGSVKLECADAPFSFNTPHLPFAQYSPTGVSPLMPEDTIDALEALRTETAAFLEGKRAQGDLFERAA